MASERGWLSQWEGMSFGPVLPGSDCPPFCVSELASEEAYGEAVLESPQDGKQRAKSENSRRHLDFSRPGGRPRPARTFCPSSVGVTLIMSLRKIKGHLPLRCL